MCIGVPAKRGQTQNTTVGTAKKGRQIVTYGPISGLSSVCTCRLTEKWCQWCTVTSPFPVRTVQDSFIRIIRRPCGNILFYFQFQHSSVVFTGGRGVMSQDTLPSLFAIGSLTKYYYSYCDTCWCRAQPSQSQASAGTLTFMFTFLERMVNGKCTGGPGVRGALHNGEKGGFRSQSVAMFSTSRGTCECRWGCTAAHQLCCSCRRGDGS